MFRRTLSAAVFCAAVIGSPGVLAAVNNLTNRPNFSGFSGIRTSRFYLTPTSVTNPRKFDLGIGIRF